MNNPVSIKQGWFRPYESPEKWCRHYVVNGKCVSTALIEQMDGAWYARLDGALSGKNLRGYKTVEEAKAHCDRARGVKVNLDWKKEYAKLKEDYDELVRRHLQVCGPEVCGSACAGDPLRCAGFEQWKDREQTGLAKWERK